MKTRYKHIIWDWNGTLLNDCWLCVEIMNGLLEPRQLQLLTEVRYREIFDFPVRDYYVKLGFDLEKEPFERVGIDFINIYQKRWRECSLQEAGSQILASVTKLGVSQSLLSAMEHRALEAMVQHHRLEPHFKLLSGIDDHYAAGKVARGREHLAALEVAHEDVLFVGDTRHDHEVADALGTDCVLIACGHHAHERLEATGRPVFQSLQEIIPFLQDVK